ncbi:MAG TPA: AzlD domain-containing protein [Acidimicrobiia bacterium]|jgi:branched-subunit amino acid transport protein
MTLTVLALVATVVVGIGTYFMRSSFIHVFADREFSPVVRQALRYVAPSVMAALVVSLGVGGSAEVGIPEVSALVVGGVVGWRARSLPSVLVAGMVTLWVLRALI